MGKSLELSVVIVALLEFVFIFLHFHFSHFFVFNAVYITLYLAFRVFFRFPLSPAQNFTEIINSIFRTVR